MMAKIYLPLLVLFFALSSCSTSTNDEKTIRNETEKFVLAYNKHDAKALSLLFAEDGDYIRPESLVSLHGREAIENYFNEQFKLDSEAKVEVTISKIIFPSKEDATLSGTFLVKRIEQEPKESAFRAFFEKNDGKWVIGEIRDIDIAPTPNQYVHLKELEWLIGDWVDQDVDVEIKISSKWNKSKNLIVGNFSVITEGQPDLEGTHVIAWDPIKEKNRSWFFDSDGGFGESIWTKNDKSWVAETFQTLADGKLASAINIYTPIDSNSYTWESVSREVGGQILPDIEPVTVIKKKG